MNAQTDFDLIVIGAGSGGLAGAFRAATHGARVALMEPAALGGTCVNVGCVPKKAMWLAADAAQRLSLAASLGFALPSPTAQLDWPTFIGHRQRYIDGIHASYRKRLDENGIVCLPMRGHLHDAHTVVGADGTLRRAAHILIATGGTPRRPALPGAELGGVSDDFFALSAPPPRVAVIGGGYIAVELGGVMQMLGSQVELFVRGQSLLAGFEHELTAELLQDNGRHGLHAHFGYALAQLQAAPEGRVLLVDAQGRHSGPFDNVFFATGRQPNTEGLGLENAGVQQDAQGYIQVDPWQNTNVAHIHAVGDVTAAPALTPVAIAAARRLMDRLYGGKPESRLEYRDIATVVFSHPPIGKIGLTEHEARARFGDANVQVYRARFRPMLHALADSPQRSVFKLICEGAEERVVGLHLLGEGADEILQGFAVAIRRGITRRDLEDTVAIHPTSAEEVVLMR